MENIFLQFANKNNSRSLETFQQKSKKVNLVIHLGAITSTTEKNVKLIIENNLNLNFFMELVR